MRGIMADLSDASLPGPLPGRPPTVAAVGMPYPLRLWSPMELLTDAFTWATSLIDTLTTFVSESPWTYLLIFVLVAVDVVFPLLPAEAIVTTAAVIAGQGQLNILWVMVAAGLGAFVGDNVAYWIGRAAGRPLVDRILRDDTTQLERVERQFKRRGGVFVIVGRFVPGGRTVVAIGAGAVRFSWPRFLLYDLIAAVIWSFQAALPGYIGGIVVQDKPWLALVIGLGLSAVVAAGLTLFQRWREGRGADLEAGGDETVEQDRAEPAASRDPHGGAPEKETAEASPPKSSAAETLSRG